MRFFLFLAIHQFRRAIKWDRNSGLCYYYYSGLTSWSFGIFIFQIIVWGLPFNWLGKYLNYFPIVIRVVIVIIPATQLWARCHLSNYPTAPSAPYPVCLWKRPHPEYAVIFWSPNRFKDLNLLERVHRRPTTNIRALRNASYLEWLKWINFSLSRYEESGVIWLSSLKL